MLSHPIVNDMWYDMLSTSIEEENPLQNLNQARNSMSATRCLVMNKVSNSDPKYSIRTEDCNEKHVAVCRAKPQKVTDKPKPSKFPCLTQNHSDRRKRSLGNEKPTQRDMYKGVKSIFY